MSSIFQTEFILSKYTYCEKNCYWVCWQFYRYCVTFMPKTNIIHEYSFSI